MIISELIDQLTEVKRKRGDIHILVWRADSNCYELAADLRYVECAEIYSLDESKWTRANALEIS